MLNYEGICISVRDMETSKRFYTGLLEQEIQMDLGVHVAFGGFALQSDFAQMLQIPDGAVAYGPNNAELYFETEDVREFQKRLDGWGGVRCVHPVREQPWKQRVVRFYDPDDHVIEVAESMEVTICRLLREGVSPGETAEQTMCPLPFVLHCMETMEKK